MLSPSVRRSGGRFGTGPGIYPPHRREPSSEERLIVRLPPGKGMELKLELKGRPHHYPSNPRRLQEATLETLEPLRRRRTFKCQPAHADNPVDVAVEKLNIEALRLELAQLVREERELSDVRRKLHERIDSGFANEVTIARERQISDERMALHRRIDALRAQIDLHARSRKPEPVHTAAALGAVLSQDRQRL